MNLKEITKDWLKGHGYGGLYGEDGCDCEIDDLMHCYEPSINYCFPGYKVDCPKGHSYDFMITPDKEKKDCN